MKAITLTALIGVIFLASCMDREPAPVCPVPKAVNQSQNMVSGFDGVDLLVVVDNSASMGEEQAILGTGFFTLINSLVNPIASDPDWPYPEVENMRVAIATSDMGLQYGENGATKGWDHVPVNSCNDGDRNPKGDDGRFQTSMPRTIEVAGDVISCDQEADSPPQCPPEWNCNNNGRCAPAGGGGEGQNVVNCPSMDGRWVETEEDDKNSNLARQVACLGEQGTNGCGVEQQLEASVRALSRNKDQQNFMKDSHLLTVLIVSDEEDCSIKRNGLFQTEEWESGSANYLNTACNLPAENEEFLFEPSRYWDKLVELKNNQARAVVFAAIVGVPYGNNEAGDACQGTGPALKDCLDRNEMKLRIKEFEINGTNKHKHFDKACSRSEGEIEVTGARPGRRFVDVAQRFGSNGYIYSICNKDWSPAMREIAKVIAESMTPSCYPKPLEWSETGGDCGGYDECGKASCDVVIEYLSGAGNPQKCPGSFNAADDRVVVEEVRDNDGTVTGSRVLCPLPKLLAPIKCQDAKEMYGESSDVGWFYCEDSEENFNATCDDNLDNDDDGQTDCDDEGCADCTVCPDGSGQQCESSCEYGVELTVAAKDLARGRMVLVRCLQEFSFEDKNCQENTRKTCTDNEDNDANGIWDCNDISGKNAHRADPNCCPLDKNCRPTNAAFANCPKSSRANPPSACEYAARAEGCQLKQ